MCIQQHREVCCFLNLQLKASDLDCGNADSPSVDAPEDLTFHTNSPLRQTPLLTSPWTCLGSHSLLHQECPLHFGSAF